MSETIVAEEWRRVKGYEGWYEVSNLGRVRSVDRVVRRGVESVRRTGRILKRNRATKYPTVILAKDATRHSFAIHTLVAEAFIGPRPAGNQVNHKDGEKSNCCEGNLEYTTPLQNMRHAIIAGLINNKGEANGFAKISDYDVAVIREFHRRGMSQAELARRLKISKSQVNRIVLMKARIVTSSGVPI